MVKIAMQGGSGEVASEIIDFLLAEKKHDILIFSRKDPAPNHVDLPGTTTVKVDYDDVDDLVEKLKGVHTVLSFASTFESQKNLIDASVRSGVKRFAPSEWVTKHVDRFDHYHFKNEVRNYLRDLNKDKKVLEYTLFQPSWLLNYLASPRKTMNHVTQLESYIDIENCRALLIEGADDVPVVSTTIQDLAKVVCRAVEYEGEWPVIGGIRGSRNTPGELVQIGEKIRGKPFTIRRLKKEDILAGNSGIGDGWYPIFRHPVIDPANYVEFSKVLTETMLMCAAEGEADTSDEWNRLLPDMKFTGAEQFLSEVFKNETAA